MIAELGHFSLILALCVAVLLSIVPLIGSFTGTYSWMALSRPASQVLLLMVGISYAILTYSFLVHDFSVKYVANTSNLSLPLMYRISGVWGSHEGSLLLWMLILAGWGAAGVCRVLCGFCVCSCSAYRRSSRHGVGALDATLDKRRVDVSDDRHRTWKLVGLLRVGLGWLVVLGSGRKRILYAVVNRYGTDSFISGYGKKGRV